METAAKVLLLTLMTVTLSVAKNDPPLGCVQVENVAHHRFLMPANGTWPYLPRERLVQFGLAIGARNWMLEKVGKEFRFRTYLGQLEPAFLFTVLWRSRLKMEKSGYFTIKNVNLKEYLFAGEPQNSVTGQVFTRKGKKSKNFGPEFLWSISSC
ncbi:uncharacterized protein LOC119767692 [Culex quinquefasciatus]|uniref:uncharacterized protein LOC119767692 n=1 Tax=Culex quinquefasciatus TaxID=7176 RepID=UPI0018E354B5|nr:uncharacterized protein LOC119767692 [Culex quinquefasciatus]